MLPCTVQCGVALVVAQIGAGIAFDSGRGVGGVRLVRDRALVAFRDPKPEQSRPLRSRFSCFRRPGGEAALTAPK